MAKRIVCFLWGAALSASICLGIFIAPGFFGLTAWLTLPFLLMAEWFMVDHWSD